MSETTITAMVRVRRWRWWPFAHPYVPAPRMRLDEVVYYASPEVRQIRGAR